MCSYSPFFSLSGAYANGDGAQTLSRAVECCVRRRNWKLSCQAITYQVILLLFWLIAGAGDFFL